MTVLILSLIISLLLTMAVYFLPIVIFRFLIIKKPFPKKKARTIAIIWAIISFVLFTILRAMLGDEVSTNVAPAFLWGMIDYYILKSGSDDIEDEEQDTK